MFTIFCLIFFSLRKSLRSRAELHAEILALRHQLLVLQRSTQGGRVQFRATDRGFWCGCLVCGKAGALVFGS
jgi:hypothetical protein